MSWLKKLLRIHTHERRLFLLGKYCLVKCTTCGAESIPWEPAQEAANAAREQHASDGADYDKLCKDLRMLP